MDRDIYEAAVEGSVTILQNLLQQDTLVLDRIPAGRHAETPLHLASLCGHAEFVREILSRKPELAGVVDSRKSLPLHLAAAKGYLDIVKMLATVKPEACCVCDGDGRNPLHIAAIKGHVSVLKELVQIRSDAAQMISTDRGQTILHLCVRYNQLQAMNLLMESMHRDIKFLNLKDEDGNTLLHVAVAEKQIEAIKILTSNTAIKVNALNVYGFTALDLSTQSRRDVKDWEIWELLRRFGAVNAKDIRPSAHEFRTTEMVRTFTPHGNHPANALRPQNNSSGNDTQKDWLEKMRSALMVVASLIATMAFQVAVTPPGGLWQEQDNSPSDQKAPQPESHKPGRSILAAEYPDPYGQLVAVNTTGFLASLSIILLLISGLPIRRRIFLWILMVIMWIAITAMALTYLFCITALAELNNVIDNTAGVILVVWFGLMGVVLLCHMIRFIVRTIKYFRKSIRQRNQDPFNTVRA